jgi:hypothetical protein
VLATRGRNNINSETLSEFMLDAVLDTTESKFGVDTMSF